MIPNSRLYSFAGGASGPWKVTEDRAILGDALPRVTHVTIRSGWTVDADDQSAWSLHGVTSNTRYVTQEEKAELAPVEPPLGREESTLAVMIPLRKNDSWWAMTQEERREIFARSAHHANGMKALPEIARRLHHCRDLATAEPYDFITWFEFAPASLSTFETLLAELRDSEEWQYIDREYEVRLERSVERQSQERDEATHNQK